MIWSYPSATSAGSLPIATAPSSCDVVRSTNPMSLASSAPIISRKNCSSTGDRVAISTSSRQLSQSGRLYRCVRTRTSASSRRLRIVLGAGAMTADEVGSAAELLLVDPHHRAADLRKLQGVALSRGAGAPRGVGSAGRDRARRDRHAAARRVVLGAYRRHVGRNVGIGVAAAASFAWLSGFGATSPHSFTVRRAMLAFGLVAPNPA